MSGNKRDGAKKETWLILSHCFNMDGRAASITITDKLPLLEQAGIEPVILSGVSGTKDAKYEHHQMLPWGPAGFRFDVRHVIAIHLGRGIFYKILVGLLGLLLSPFILLERLLLGWQNQWAWAFPATLRSLWLIRKYKPTVLYSTGGAYSAHLAGYWLKRLTGINWIVEVHDPLVKPGVPLRTRDEKMQAYIERIICKGADFVWWFTEGAVNSARKRNPVLGARGAYIIPGVGAPSVKGKYQRGEKMIISHFGSISDTRSMLPVVTALHALLAKQPAMRERLSVHIYGGDLDHVSKAEISRLKLGDIFVVHGRLERDPQTGLSGRERVVQKMFEADCLLLLHGTIPECSEYIPSKLYEYMWAGRPVIALTFQNPQLDRLVSERGGYVAHGDQPAEVMQVLEQAYTDWSQDALRLTNVQPLDVRQAVDQILQAVRNLPGSE